MKEATPSVQDRPAAAANRAVLVRQVRSFTGPRHIKAAAALHVVLMPFLWFPASAHDPDLPDQAWQPK
ncbi:hypothetical protein NDU88_008913 [Pleurodeles waltl]|uniref:Uncharacterized protein n=1 Tax=Pleurodeles waltl TaxID=8319 RepID=A0AAV7RV64_PLEWA|nr:hypothetical protein NDU88_008913 [Pleurodeles waltl]